MAKILVAEDDPLLGSMLVSFLKSESYTVEFADNGDTALDILFVGDFDAIVMDWELPGRSGIDVITEYRASGGKAPVLMLTGKKTIEEKTIGFSAGTDDYLTKPFEPQELSLRLRALLRRVTASRTDVLVLGSMQLDPKTHLVTVDGNTLDLPRIEFGLLEFLLRGPDQVFSTDALMNRVWTSDADCSVESVRVCVARLRSKLKGLKNCPVIETVHGVGYCLKLKEDILGELT